MEVGRDLKEFQDGVRAPPFTRGLQIEVFPEESSGEAQGASETLNSALQPRVSPPGTN